MPVFIVLEAAQEIVMHNVLGHVIGVALPKIPILLGGNATYAMGNVQDAQAHVLKYAI